MLHASQLVGHAARLLYFISNRLKHINPVSGDVQEQFDLFYNNALPPETIMPSLRKFLMRRHRSPWLNAEIRQLMKHRDFVAKQLSRNPSSSQLQDELKLLRKKVKSKIRHEAKEQ